MFLVSERFVGGGGGFKIFYFISSFWSYVIAATVSRRKDGKNVVKVVVTLCQRQIGSLIAATVSTINVGKNVVKVAVTLHFWFFFNKHDNQPNFQVMILLQGFDFSHIC